MDARLVRFGEIEVDGKRYSQDLVIERGRVRRRKKGPSKQLRNQFGHTPLSLAEDIPWRPKTLLIGTGADGRLPIMDGVYKEAERRGIRITALPTREVCRLLRDLQPDEVNAILHVTC